MTNKRYLYGIIAITILSMIAFASSYAFFSVDTQNTIVGNYEAIFDDKYRFSVSGTSSDSIIVSDFDMFGVNEDKIVVDKSHDITISIENLVDTVATQCTYDYVWRWDMTHDNYQKSSGATYEYMVSGPFTSVNVPDYDADSFVLGSSSISLQAGQDTNSKTVTINTKFYNLGSVDQGGHANHTYKGGVIIDNISCS